MLPPDGETDLLCQKCGQEDRDLGAAPLICHYDQVQGAGGEGEDGQESLLHFTSEGVAETGGVGQVDDDHGQVDVLGGRPADATRWMEAGRSQRRQVSHPPTDDFLIGCCLIGGDFLIGCCLLGGDLLDAGGRGRTRLAEVDRAFHGLVDSDRTLPSVVEVSWALFDDVRAPAQPPCLSVALAGALDTGHQQQPATVGQGQASQPASQASPQPQGPSLPPDPPHQSPGQAPHLTDAGSQRGQEEPLRYPPRL